MMDPVDKVWVDPVISEKLANIDRECEMRNV